MMLEFGSCDDGSAHWLRIGSLHFGFAFAGSFAELKAARLTSKAAAEAQWRWAAPALSLPLRVAYVAAVAGVAIGLLGDVWL